MALPPVMVRMPSGVGFPDGLVHPALAPAPSQKADSRLSMAAGKLGWTVTGTGQCCPRGVDELDRVRWNALRSGGANSSR